MSRSIQDMTGIPPTKLTEVLVIPCSGCEVRQLSRDVAHDVVYDRKPESSHWTCIVAIGGGLPSMQWEVTEADSVIALEGCEKKCVSKICAGLRAPDRTVVITDEIGTDLAGYDKLSDEDKGKCRLQLIDRVDAMVAEEEAKL